MKLVTQTSVLDRRVGIDKAIEILADSGYDALDFSLFDMLKDDCPKLKPEYNDEAKRLRELAKSKGLSFVQAHAPFPSSQPDDKFTESAFKKIVRSLEICGILGVEDIVVHPKQHLKYADNAEYLKEINIEFYKSLIPYCKEYKVRVAMENMWQLDDNRKITHSTCSRLEEFKEYLDAVDSEWIVACLDIGHAHLMEDREIAPFIHGLMPRLKCLHVHSTGNNSDLHVLPYYGGDTPWDEVLKALADSGYQGHLTFEADETFKRYPDELLPTVSKFMADVGHYMIKEIESYK